MVFDLIFRLFHERDIDSVTHLPADFVRFSSVSTLLRFSNLYPEDFDWDLDSLCRLLERGICNDINYLIKINRV